VAREQAQLNGTEMHLIFGRHDCQTDLILANTNGQSSLIMVSFALAVSCASFSRSSRWASQQSSAVIFNAAL
jgi:hypothetical protein